jgi:hypothetical protein
MAQITLEELRLQVRQRADMEKSKFVKDSEVTTYINNSIAELHDILSEAYGSEYFVESTDATALVADQADYDLPEDFYELKGVDIQLDGQEWITITPFNFNERNRNQNSAFAGWNQSGAVNVRYRLIGNTIRFSPAPNVAANYRLWYVPLAERLVDDDDTLNDFNAYSEYVVVDAAIKCMQKEESDVSVLMAQKAALEKRIRDKAANRDAAHAESISDIYAADDDYYWQGS